MIIGQYYVIWLAIKHDKTLFALFMTGGKFNVRLYVCEFSFRLASEDIGMLALGLAHPG